MSSGKDSQCGLRLPSVTNDFLEKTIANGAHNKKSDFFVVGSTIAAVLDNELTWKDTFENTKKRTLFERDMNVIARNSSFLVDLKLLEDAGITQETLDHVFLFFTKLAGHINLQLDELKKKK